LTITLRDIGKRFNRDWIFRSFSYRFASGTTYAITGPNGSGKSTLLSVLSGQVPLSKGEISYTDSQEAPVSPDDIYRHVAIAAPYLDLIEEFTVAEHLAFHFKMKALRTGLSSDQLLDRLYLSEAREKAVLNLSSGMKQRLKLGLALWSDAKILLLDEPGTNLDSRAFEWYVNELSQVPSDRIVIIASNNTAEYPVNSEVLTMSDLRSIAVSQPGNGYNPPLEKDSRM
jgi:ABC-type multidrug transport system ATPase subunit